MDKLLIVIYAVLVAATIYSGKNGGFDHADTLKTSRRTARRKTAGDSALSVAD